MNDVSRAAFEAVFRDTHARLRRYVERRVPNREIAEDVVSESYAAAWQRSLSGKRIELPWLYRVASNKIADHYRSTERQRALEESLAQVADGDTDPDRLLSCIALRDALLTLRPREREAIMLTYWEGLRAAEVAVVLSCSVASAWAILSRARKKLHRSMGDHVETVVCGRGCRNDRGARSARQDDVGN